MDKYFNRHSQKIKEQNAGISDEDEPVVSKQLSGWYPEIDVDPAHASTLAAWEHIAESLFQRGLIDD
jgi:hypothetical protein